MNVIETIQSLGHDEDFAPQEDDSFTPTDHPPGSIGKIEELANRVVAGHPLFHKNDKSDFDGSDNSVVKVRVGKR